MVWHGMFRVVPFAFSVEKSTPDGKKYASGAGALVTNHSYAKHQRAYIQKAKNLAETGFQLRKIGGIREAIARKKAEFYEKVS